MTERYALCPPCSCGSYDGGPHARTCLRMIEWRRLLDEEMAESKRQRFRWIRTLLIEERFAKFSDETLSDGGPLTLAEFNLQAADYGLKLVEA